MRVPEAPKEEGNHSCSLPTRVALLQWPSCSLKAGPPASSHFPGSWDRHGPGSRVPAPLEAEAEVTQAPSSQQPWMRLMEPEQLQQ